MEWLWIILRYLFPRDPLRQGAEAMRHRARQLVHAIDDPDTLALLLVDPALRLQLEVLILDAEDCLRLWVSMRGCQIAKIGPTMPWSRAVLHPTHPRDLPELIARIRALVADCNAMEKRAQAHAAKLKQMREAAPFAAQGSTKAARRAAAHHEALKSLQSNAGLMASRPSTRRAEAQRRREDEAMLTATSRAPPHSNAGKTP